MSIPRLLFNAHGRLGIINIDGSDERYLTFDVKNQVSWGWGPLFADGRRVILTSYEEGKAWEGQVQTHLWIYDLEEDRLIEEIATKNKPAPFMGCSNLLPGETRIITNPIIEGKQRIWIMNLDGSDPQKVTGDEEGFNYGVQVSPEGRRLAFHTTGLPGRASYSIFVTDLDGSHRLDIASHPDHLYFGPMWSPDGMWLIYQDCTYKTDPGHDWSDLCLSKADGSDHRVITEGQRHWFGTSYGSPVTRGSGSNMATWSPDGRTVTCTRSEPGSRTAWPYQPQRPDTDHFNRDYYPEEAEGGTAICLLNPFTGETIDLIPYESPIWNFRAVWSPDRARMAFCRAAVGEPSSLWVVNADGSGGRLLTNGHQNKGADHPVWITGEQL